MCAGTGQSETPSRKRKVEQVLKEGGGLKLLPVFPVRGRVHKSAVRQDDSDQQDVAAHAPIEGMSCIQAYLIAEQHPSDYKRSDTGKQRPHSLSKIASERSSKTDVHAADLLLPQLLQLVWRAASEEITDGLGSEVVKSKVNVTVRGHVVAPHGTSEIVPDFSADEYDAMLGLDGSGRREYDVFLEDGVLNFVDDVCVANPSGLGE